MAFEVQLKQQHQHQTHVLACGGASRNLKPLPITLDLFHSKIVSSTVELDEPSPLPSGWQKCLNLETGEIYYSKDNQSKTMSRNGKNTRLDLKLNLSPPPRANRQQQAESPNRSGNSSPTSPPSSCISSELDNNERYSTSPEATSMVLVGCPRCLMYVMLSQEDPKCPKCKSTVLLDFMHETNSTKKTKKN